MAENLIGPQGAGQTPIDDLSGLLVDIKTRQELNDLEAENNNKAYSKYLLFMKPDSKLNPFTYESFIQIHKDMFGEVWDWAGEKRKTEKNLGVPPARIGSEIHRFLYDFNKWNEEGMSSSEIAARIHQRLAHIHPFENGNGRWARLVTNIYLHRKGISLIKWPADQDFIRKVFKQKYLSALKTADNGDYGLLSKIHAECTINK